MSNTIQLALRQRTRRYTLASFSSRLKHIGYSKVLKGNLALTSSCIGLTTPIESRRIFGFQSRKYHSDSILPQIIPSVKEDGAKIQIDWDSSRSSKFHSFWLRDHCRCPQCFHSITKQRLVNTFEISPNIRPTSVNETENGLEVIWDSPSHTSLYDWAWLKTNSYDPVFKDARTSTTTYGRDPKNISLWGSEISDFPPTVDHDFAMSDDKGLFKMLKNIATFGFSFVSGVEATTETTEKLALRIGNIRHTQYGGFWEFTSNLAKGDTAYTTLALQAHTDSTYFTDPCGLQLFHLLSHTDGSGGATLLVDGFYVASVLRDKQPNAFDILTKVLVPTHAAGEPGAFYSSAPGYPIINLGHGIQSDDVVQIRYNNDDRSAMRDMKSEELEEWYDALRLWDKYLKSLEAEYWVQLEPGTAVVIDNHRVLHGRSAFVGKRRMCGAYIGMDDYLSKLTVLSERYAQGTATERSIWSPLL